MIMRRGWGPCSAYLAAAAVLLASPVFAQEAAQAPAAGAAVPAAPAPVGDACPVPPEPVAVEKAHALSLIGKPRMPADFKHFDWVNPNAPKGGTVRQFAFGSYDTLNGFSAKGDPAGGLGILYDTLLASSLDEPSTEYGLVAEWVSHPADYSSVTFGLRPDARFHDGEKIKPEDVIFSLEALKKPGMQPFYAFYYKNVVKAEKVGDNQVTFTFDTKGNRELPLIMGQLPVLPKHWWEGKNAKGVQRDAAKTLLDEAPLGSGAYKIKSYEAGRQITLERVKDYWAKDLPVRAGQWNYDEMVFTYFRDRTPGFEDFKSGRIDVWFENQASAWATAYDIDPIKKGLMKKEAIPVKRIPPMQAFVFNQRRPQFQDSRVRRAFNLAYDFEESNRQLFYGLYVRVGSYFDNSELAAKGLPQGCELSILKEVEKEVPPAVFTTEWKNPVNGDAMARRKNLQEAVTLLTAAGWTIKQENVDDPDCGFFCRLFGSTPTENVLRNKDGKTLDAEFLLVSPDFEKIVLPYVQALKSLGTKASIRIVDPAQYKRREDTHDYDVIIDNFPQSESPGNEQRDFWGSQAADRDGSRNTAGIKNPAVDKLIDRIVFAKTREELVGATRALDRVLLWNNYVVPHWHYPFERIVTWDRYGRPDKLPAQTAGFLQTWWVDEAKDKALIAARGR